MVGGRIPSKKSAKGGETVYPNLRSDQLIYLSPQDYCGQRKIIFLDLLFKLTQRTIYLQTGTHADGSGKIVDRGFPM